MVEVIRDSYRRQLDWEGDNPQCSLAAQFDEAVTELLVRLEDSLEQFSTPERQTIGNICISPMYAAQLLRLTRQLQIRCTCRQLLQIAELPVARAIETPEGNLHRLAIATLVSVAPEKLAEITTPIRGGVDQLLLQLPYTCSTDPKEAVRQVITLASHYVQQPDDIKELFAARLEEAISFILDMVEYTLLQRQILEHADEVPQILIETLFHSRRPELAVSAAVTNAFVLTGRRLVDDVKLHLNRSLHSQLMQILEIFSASFGAIYICDEIENELSLAASHSLETHSSVSSDGDVEFAVFETTEPQCIQPNESTNSSLLRSVDVQAKSLCVVPLLLHHQLGKPPTKIGVVAIATVNDNSLTHIHAARLQSESYSLLIDALVWQNQARGEFSAVWHPLAHGWSISTLADKICRDLSSSLRQSPLELRVGCALWEYDRKQLYVRGTDGYDEEYRAGLTLSSESAIARIARNGKPAIIDPTSDPDFERSHKANRMGLSALVVIPMSPTRPNGNVLVFYLFGHNSGRISQLMLDSGVESLAVKFSEGLHDLLALKTQCAVAAICHATLSQSIAHVSVFDQVRYVFQQVLNADASTLFGMTKDTLQCVSTSGITHGNVPVHQFSRVKYSVNEEGGFTTHLVKHPENVLRANDIRDDSQILGIDGKTVSVSPINKYVETYLSGEYGHRRFLGCAVRHTNEVVGVIRILRSFDRRPFINNDSHLIRAMCSAASLPFVRWQVDATDNQPSPFYDIRPASFIPGFSPDSFEAGAGERLFRPLPVFPSWNIRTVNSILTDLLSIMDCEKAIFASVRISDTSTKRLRLFAFQSLRRRTPPSETQRQTHEESDRSIGIEAIERQNIITFTTPCSTFIPIDDMSSDVNSGIVFPLNIIGRDWAVSGVLSVDFASEIEWTAPKLLLVFHAVRKLSILCADNRITSRLAPRLSEAGLRESCKEFISQSFEECGVAAAQLRFRDPANIVRPFPVGQYIAESDADDDHGSRLFAELDSMSENDPPLFQDFGQLSPKGDGESGRFSLQLPFGSCATRGQIIGRLKPENRNGKMKKSICSLFNTWQTFASFGLNGARASVIDPRFRLVPQEGDAADSCIRHWECIGHLDDESLLGSRT